MKLELTNTTCRVSSATDEETTWLRDYLSFDDESKAFRRDRKSGRVKRVQPPKKRLYDVLGDTFPAGVLPLIRRRAAAMGMTIEINDVRPPGPGMNPMADTAWLRDYQRDALHAAMSKERGILWLPTGSGKTEIMVGLTRVVPCRWLMIVHRAGLMHQAADRYDQRNAEHGVKLPPAGRFGDGVHEVGDRLTVATFQTLRARAKSQLISSSEGLVVDECFPAGTLVAGVPIEQLCPGDLVPSYADGRIVHRPIGKVFSRLPTGLVRLDLSDGTSMVCTPGHPFLTEDGYLPAESLCGHTVYHGEQDPDNPMLVVWKADTPYVDSEESRSLLRSVPQGTKGSSTEANRGVLRRMRSRDGTRGSAGAGAGTTTSNVLLRGLSREGAVKVGASNGARQRRDSSDADAGIQPDERSRDSKEGFASAERDRPPAKGQRRQREGTDGSPVSIGRSARLADGGNRGDGEEAARKANSLLGRHSGPGAQDSDRDRRSLASSAGQTGFGRAEDCVLGGVRVDRVAVLEPGSDGTYGGLCPDGNVYNLHVPGPETYLVGPRGLIVHNCHTLPAETFYSVAMAMTSARMRIGLSGTPLDRDDKRSLMAVGAVGPVIFRLRTDALVDAGVLAAPRVRMARVEQDFYRPTWKGVYGEGVVRSRPRNGAIIDIAAHLAARPMVVFVKHIDHGRALRNELERAGLRVELVWGNTREAGRKSAVQSLVRGDLDAVVASVVWQEGVDIPELRSIVVAAGGKSTIASLQRAGRGMRRTDDKDEFELWDVHDRGNQMLERQASARRRAYERDGFKVEIVDVDQLELKEAPC